MTRHHPTIRLKRAYDAPGPEDGTRVLVDRLWPRGLSKDAAHLDLWLKEIAPSDELRKWFKHDPEKFPEFRRRYEAELAEGPAAAALARLRALSQQGPVTLVYAAHDEEHNDAVVLREVLTRR